mgnify:CR=1 FL=1
MRRKKENQEKKGAIIVNRGGRLKKKEMHISIDKLDRFSELESQVWLNRPGKQYKES